MLTFINFSGRTNGNCAGIADVVRACCGEEKVVLTNFSQPKISPCGDCDYPCLRTGETCPVEDGVVELYETIAQSELTVFIVPNYCDYPCANFFAFNERGCGYFGGGEDRLQAYLAAKKKFIVVSNSNTAHFKDAFQYHVAEGQEPDILYLSAKKFGCNSLDGNLMELETARNLVRAFVRGEYEMEESCMAVVLSDGKILATRELIYGKETLSLPKGHIEIGETHADTAIRECFEETDVVLSRSAVVKELEPYMVRFTDHHFKLVCKAVYPVVFQVGDCGMPRAKEERMIDARFMEVNEFLVSCTYDNVKQIVKQAIDIID